MNADSRIWERARQLLCGLQTAVQARLIAARRREGKRFAEVAAEAPEDTIFRVDRISEAVVFSWLEQNWPREWTTELVMEGVPPGTTFPRGTAIAATRWKLILDPIDGTRGLMYDKRSAWSLAGLAPQRGARTGLRDIGAAAMTELPTSKAGWADQLSATRGGPLRATRTDLRDGVIKKWIPTPSTATGFERGFSSVVKFFPEHKVATAEVEERLWRELGLHGREGGGQIYDDQYISTGGQLYELIVGHDRMVADLRPVIAARAGVAPRMCCHPYDICTALLLEAVGGVVERPEGGALRAPLDTMTPVTWVGYANRALARRARAALRRALG